MLPAVLLLVSMMASPGVRAGDFEIADRVIVRKSERKLLLMKNGKILRSFDVALGLMPVGDKVREGDFRTPEGHYTLVDRNPDSDYFLSIRISYPDKQHKKQAEKQGLNPGGQIMIHGRPNYPHHPVQYYDSQDWTDGCIAVSNSAMVDIWLMTTTDTPIEIIP